MPAIKIEKLAKSPRFRHTCKGRHPELFENTGFPFDFAQVVSLSSHRLRGHDLRGRITTFYETINVGMAIGFFRIKAS